MLPKEGQTFRPSGEKQFGRLANVVVQVLVYTIQVTLCQFQSFHARPPTCGTSFRSLREKATTSLTAIAHDGWHDTTTWSSWAHQSDRKEGCVTRREWYLLWDTAKANRGPSRVSVQRLLDVLPGVHFTCSPLQPTLLCCVPLSSLILCIVLPLLSFTKPCRRGRP